MTQSTLTTHVQNAEKALTALLKDLIGDEVPLETSTPESVRPDGPLRQKVEARFSLHAAGHQAVVVLDPAWVPLFSEAMLGEAMDADSDGALDLMQEIAAQCFGTVQSTLAADGLELPAIRFDGSVPGESSSPLDGNLWRVSFSAQHKGDVLDGFVLLPAVENASAGPESAAGDRAASPTASAQPSASQSSSAERESVSTGGAARQGSGVDVAPAAFDELGDETLGGDGGGDPSNFELLAEVNLEVRVELGRRELPLADVLKLTTGSVIELEKMVGEPLSVYANGRLIAEGEAVVIDEQFGVRITNLVSEDRRDKAFF